MRSANDTLKRIVKLLVSICFLVAAWLMNVGRRMVRRRTGIRCVVLYYHAVPAEHRKRFAKQMDAILRLTRPIGISPVPQLSPGVSYSSVTFDDAFRNVIENALPEIAERGIPATLFVTVDALGRRADWWPADAHEHREWIVSAEELQQLPMDLISIGSHTLTHPKLPALSEMEARRELSESRVKLANLLKREVATFSFPFGAFNGNLVEWCRDAGYQRIFTTLPTIAFANSEEFVTGRVKADPTDWPLEFHLKLLGAYRWLPYAFSAKRFILGRAFVKGPAAVDPLPTKVQ